jgi:chorismate mutase
MENNAIEITDLRIKIDQLNERILSGLKTRSRFSLNQGTFRESFADGKTWFMYRLKKEQDLDAEFGRFMYNDQAPFIFSKEEIAKSKVSISANNNGIKQIQIDISKEILDLYKEILYSICQPGEDKNNFGETTKLDVEIILALNERIVGVGEQVAGYKMQANPEIIKITNKEELKKALYVPEREKEVIERMGKVAEKYGLTNIEQMKEFARRIIELTKEVEMQRILRAKTGDSQHE